MFSIPYGKKIDKEKAYSKLKSKLDNGALDKLKVKANLYYNDEDCTISAQGKGFKFSIDFFDEDAKCDLELGLFLKPMRSRIEESLKDKIKKAVS